MLSNTLTEPQMKGLQGWKAGASMTWRQRHEVMVHTRTRPFADVKGVRTPRALTLLIGRKRCSFEQHTGFIAPYNFRNNRGHKATEW